MSSVEIKDIEIPDDMRRVLAKQAEAEREKRAKVISAEGEFLKDFLAKEHISTST